MKKFLLVLLVAVAADASAQQPPVDEHAAQARQESLAMATRAQDWQKASDDRHEIQYAENRQRCEAALKNVDPKGKPATFSCGARGFQRKR